MTDENNAYDGFTPSRVGADTDTRNFDQAIKNAQTVKTTTFLGRLKSMKQLYFAQWREQPFNIAAMHVCAAILAGGVWFAIFVLPPAF